MRRFSDQFPGCVNASAICEPSSRQGWSDSFPYKSRQGRVKNGQSEPVRKSCYTHSGAVGSNHRWLLSQIRCSTICVPLYRMQNHRKPVPPVGKHSARHARFPAPHYQEEDGHTRNPDLTEVELGSAGLEEPMANALRARPRKDRLGVSCSQGHYKAPREAAR